jgi:hypothetical protein
LRYIAESIVKLSRIFAVVFVAVGLLPVAGCMQATTGSKNEIGAAPTRVMTVEERVVGRAQQRWDALVSRNFEKAFGFISPAGRSALPYDIYLNRISHAAWKGAKALSARCEGEVCDVTIQIEFEVLPGRNHSQPIEEKWILEAGEWWQVYKG